MGTERAGLAEPRQVRRRLAPCHTGKGLAGSLDYAVGDTVRHIKFDVGIVEKIEDGGRDYEVTVNFEKCGVKKMFAAFAKLKKL